MTPGTFWVRVYTSNRPWLQSLHRGWGCAGFWTGWGVGLHAGCPMLDARIVPGLGCLLVCALAGCSREPVSPRLALRGLDTQLLVGNAPLELSGDALPPGDAIVV